MTVDATEETWLQDLLAAIDVQDTAVFLNYLTPDAEFRFGSAPPARGQPAIRAAVDGFFVSIRGSRHRLLNTWRGDKSLVCEGEVTYSRHDGSDVTLPFTNVFQMSGGLIAQYKIYIDIAPLYAGLPAPMPE
jgi:ketosteroid isomerase-like protein